MTTSTAFTFPVSADNTAVQDHIMGKFVDYSHYTGALRRSGWVCRRTQVTDPDYPNHFIIVSTEGHVSYANISEMQIHSIDEYSSPAGPLTNQISLLAWEKRNLYIDSLAVRRTLLQKSAELQEWDNKVAKACQEADERGYCSEFEAIAEAAGFDVPAMEEHDVSCTVTITVTISKEARTLAKAKELVTYDDISSAISGEDSIDDWNVD